MKIRNKLLRVLKILTSYSNNCSMILNLNKGKLTNPYGCQIK